MNGGPVKVTLLHCTDVLVKNYLVQQKHSLLCVDVMDLFRFGALYSYFLLLQRQ